MSTIAIGLGVLIALVLLAGLAVLFLVSRLFKKVSQGRALIISKMRKVDVTFTGAVVLPVLHKAEYMDISVKTIEVARLGRDGLICRDNIRADIRITFFVRVNKTVEDVIKVAQAIGTQRASDQATLQELFSAKFSEALKTVGKHLDFVDLYTHRNEFRDRIMAVIGTDLNGYSLEDAAIDYLEQTPLIQLDSQNILDAQGIRKITELTAIEHVRTNEFRRHEEKEITRQNVEAREAVLELERQQADAENRQRREVETLRAREEAEILRVQAEERLKAQTAFLRTEEALAVQSQNKDREVAVAEKNRERVIAIESERIEKDRLLEVADRDRAVSLAHIANEREVETERRTVAEVVRERVAVDKTVAEQEEQINRLRATEAAERERQAIIIRAEAEAQEHLVKDIKAAEAAEAAAKFLAKESITLAEAEVEAAELKAKAKIRLAEATQAEAAAPGLGAAQVREREADAIEKVGLAEAAVLRERNQVEAEGLRDKLKGEAEGLHEKAAAMAVLDDATRQHEEFRLRLELEKEVELATVRAQVDVAQAQAEVLATGLGNAKIDIVGGESMFLDRLVGSIGLGKGLDRILHSDTGAAATAMVGSLLTRNGATPGNGAAPDILLDK
ncbi:flotillin family protein [Nocardia sp. AG03]|uniref:SPFH domain-containing protein n=1 Tax=Nocardia sp. AG03 TaxID=3025312 RepID=UPI0024184C6A|nr:flotillin family protein [Nocardia sp. AG03]